MDLLVLGGYCDEKLFIPRKSFGRYGVIENEGVCWPRHKTCAVLEAASDTKASDN
jgi:hypothetical protein